MRPDPLFDPGEDGQEPDSSRPPAGPQDGPDAGPGEQGLFLCLPAGSCDADRFAQSGPAADMPPDPLLATIIYWAPTLVPGLLQVESYARVILATEPDETESLDVLLAGRMGRQQVLSRPQPPAVTVVMAEAVLHRGVGGPAVMYEQLTHLAEESRQPKVMIQVIPAEVSAHAGLGGAASIADREGEPPVVHLDSFTAPQTTRAPEIVAKVRQRSDMLRSEALPRSASHELIMRVAEEEWKQ
jgi:hypothetical protein